MDLLALARLTSCVRVTGDQRLISRPSYLFSLVISSNGDGDADALIYDGENVKGVARFDLFAVDEAQQQLSFDPPVYMERGIFVDVGSNVESVVIQFVPENV